MSIASRITSIEEHIGNAYDSIKKFGVDTSVINKNIENIANVINDEIYDKLPKVTQSGAGFTLENVQNGQVDDFKMIGTDLYQNQLPSEYTAVEYLQSDNECFIDTGINADYKLSLKMKVACLDSVLEYMGAIKNIDNTNYIRHHLAFAPTAGNIIGIYYGQTNDQLILKEFDNNFHEFNLDIYNKKVSIDNNSTISISYNNFDVGINYYLFARNGSNIAISKGSYKIAYCKMYYEDKLVRDFAPCYRNSDNVAGLYDFVTNTFFTNQGTGTFTVGNNITLPNPDYPQDINVVEGRQVITDKGKNLLNISKNVNGYWYKNGVLTANADWSYINDFIEVKASTQYTISRDSSELNESQFSIEEFDENKNYIKQNVLWQNNTNKYSITTDSNTKYVICNYRNGYAHTDLQFESGDNRTDYEPYYEPVSYNIDLQLANIYLAKMPNTTYKNRIYKNNGNWYFEKNVEKYILDGSETWDSASSITNTSRFYTSSNILNSRDADDNNVYIIADKFKGISWKGIYSDDTTTKNAISNYNNSSNTSGRIVIRIDNNYASTINEFKTWLSTHNVIVYYALATPVTTQITNTTLIDQLEAISVHTGTNIITISNDNDMIPEIEITRLKELEKLA